MKYETDLSALPYRLAARRRREAGVPVEFDVLRSAEWAGVRDGEYLDIDWDYFACTEYPADSIATRIARFWDTALTASPAEVGICYSPEYSHPSRGLFSEFVTALADRLHFTVEALTPEGNGAPANRSALGGVLPDSMYRGTRRAYHRAARAAKQRGIF